MKESKAHGGVQLNQQLMSQWLEVFRKLNLSRRAYSGRPEPSQLSQVAEHLYCGSLAAATDARLKEHGISVVVNCSSVPFSCSGVGVVNIPVPGSSSLIGDNLEIVKVELEKCRKAGKRAALVVFQGLTRLLC
eukprot:Protomagalhaensia_wolfi_Nauph_80__1361@NODE_1813_length_1324_cov_229_217899_g1415_i0_p1_GENE_NODE_1813_length_1324_cov_229_217899_g1415_i0NODE_1813_length_1324_cov_229_217899_g1415_i0_p1_ORF_typecomplete_len133_score24_12_NODE_1813_length_1324_cov_229_217899_g1415_i043441